MKIHGKKTIGLKTKCKTFLIKTFSKITRTIQLKNIINRYSTHSGLLNILLILH